MAGKYEFAMLAALTFAKIFTSSVSLGCGAPGGVFGPIFFIGTMGGGTFQRALAHADSRIWRGRADPTRWLDWARFSPAPRMRR